MAFLQIDNVRIAGFSAGVPATVVRNDDSSVYSADYNAAAFVEMTGIRERRVDKVSCTSDLCYAASETLLADLNWNRKEIGAIIFVSQTADYRFPATSCILQDRLGLTKECYAADVNLGCSGWVYGLSIAASLMQAGNITKTLLMAGDAKRIMPEDDDPLFGFAGTVTALEYSLDAKPIKFHFGTDGSGFDAIIMPDGGTRNGLSVGSFTKELFEGKEYTRLQCRMKGMDVFSFGISTAPKSIRKLAERFEFDYRLYDYFIFHQANLKMNALIQKKLKLDNEKVPISMPAFGNTSSASIPLTIVTQLKNKIENKPTKLLCCGFGVGLSWGTVALETNNIIISDLVEI